MRVLGIGEKRDFIYRSAGEESSHAIFVLCQEIYLNI